MYDTDQHVEVRCDDCGEAILFNSSRSIPEAVLCNECDKSIVSRLILKALEIEEAELLE